MTILEAIQTAIQQLEGVVLPIRDTENSNRIRSALMLLDALKESVEKTTKPEEKTEGETVEESGGT